MTLSIQLFQTNGIFKMFIKSKNKIIARAVAVSLFFVGALATDFFFGGTPAYSMEQISWDKVAHQKQECFALWDQVSDRWTEEAKAGEQNKWNSVQQKYAEIV